MSLKNKLIKGGFWNGISQFGAQGINFVLIIILARFLSPNDFGLVGMVSVIIGFFGYFSECGLIASLIKKKEIDALDCNTAFWGGVFFGILVYLFIYCISPYIAKFYAQPELTNLARVLALVFIIGTYSFVPSALEQKQLHYKKLSIIRFISLLISGGIALLLVVQDVGVWTLVWQQISMEVAMLLGTFFWIQWKPKFQFSYPRFKTLFAFGIHVTANNLIKFFSENIDYLLVGKLLGSEILGLYTMAFRLSRYPIEKVSPILGRMLLPAFSTIQDNLEQTQKNLVRISAYVPVVILPFLAVLFFTTQPLIALVLGEKWLGTVPLIKIFIVYILCLSFSFADEPVLMIQGKIKQLNFIKLIMALLLLLMGYFVVKRVGITGMAVIYTLILSIYYTLLKRMTLKSIEMSATFYQQSMKKIYSYGLILFSIAFIIKLWLSKDNIVSLLSISLGIIIAMLVMVVYYLKIITVNPLQITMDRCIATTKNKTVRLWGFIIFFIIIVQELYFYNSLTFKDSILFSTIISHYF